MTEREERQVRSYSATMAARDSKWMLSPRYSQKALIAAHIQRIEDICRGCPPLELEALNRVLDLAIARVRELDERNKDAHTPRN